MNRAGKSNLSNINVLIVDDNTANLQLLDTLLRQEGYDVRLANSGQLALRSVQARPPTLILLDIKLPDLDGYEICRRLKADPVSSSIPVIFITALNSEGDKVKGFQTGAVDYITKPFNKEEVLARVCVHSSLRLAQLEIESLAARQSDLSERLNTAQRLAQIGSWDWDLKTNRIWWSDETYRIFGVTPQDFVPSFEATGKIIHPDDFEKYQKSFEHCIQTGQPLEMELRLVTGAGQLKYCYARGELVQNDAGQNIRFIGTIMDITERKQAQALFQSLAENLAVSVFVIQDGVLVYVNLFLSETYGYTPEELLGMPALTLVHLDDRERVRNEAAAMIKGAAAEPYEYRSLTRDGRVLLNLEIVRPITYRGKPAILGCSMDATGLRLAITRALEFEQIAQFRRDLLSAVSHELRTPLASIMGYASMLLNYDHKLEPAEKRQYLEAIEEATVRLTALVDRLLGMARMESGQLRLDREPVVMENLLTRVVEENRLSKPGRRIDLELPAPLPPLEADPLRIEEVLDNLLDNALKYSGGDQPVTVRAVPGEGEIVISVTDGGTGIAEDSVPLIFDSAFKAMERPAPGLDGLGLGLPLCRGLVQAHGGRIWVESAPGKGSTFSFSLPVQGATVKQPGPPEEAFTAGRPEIKGE